MTLPLQQPRAEASTANRSLSTPTVDGPRVARLVEAAQAGDRVAIGELYLHYFDRVYRYLSLSLRNADDAAEVAQQVFLRVVEALPRYTAGRAPFAAWLFTIVRHEASTRRIELRRTTPVDPAGLQHDLERNEAPNAPPFSWSSDEEIDQLVGRLPAVQRRVVTLRYIYDKKLADIARVTRSTPQAVEQAHHRALHILAERLLRRGRGPASPVGDGVAVAKCV